MYSFKNCDGNEIELPVDRRRLSAISGWREDWNRHHISVILQFLLLWGSQNQAYVISQMMVYLSNENKEKEEDEEEEECEIKRPTAATTTTKSENENENEANKTE